MPEKIFTGYWKMGHVNLQRGFITKTVAKIERHIKSGSSRRSNTFLYQFIIGHDVIKSMQDILSGYVRHSTRPNLWYFQ